MWLVSRHQACDVLCKWLIRENLKCFSLKGKNSSWSLQSALWNLCIRNQKGISCNYGFQLRTLKIFTSLLFPHFIPSFKEKRFHLKKKSEKIKQGCNIFLNSSTIIFSWWKLICFSTLPAVKILFLFSLLFWRNGKDNASHYRMVDLLWGCIRRV